MEELDLMQVLQQLRIFRLIATSLLRRNQTELVPYSAMYTCYFKPDTDDDISSYLEDSRAVEQDQYNFKFNTGQIRTVSDLLNQFEARNDSYDKTLLYFLTGKETQSCMKNWQESNDFGIGIGIYESDVDLLASRPDFAKYLAEQPDDLDMSQLDQDKLDKILLLPNGDKYTLNESLLNDTIDFHKRNTLKGKKESIYTSTEKKGRGSFVSPQNPLFKLDIEET